ncbi:MAG: type II toxin-antitoxin system Xre/ParS family antitoxin [Adhaeribacter sp.]
MGSKTKNSSGQKIDKEQDLSSTATTFKTRKGKAVNKYNKTDRLDAPGQVSKSKQGTSAKKLAKTNLAAIADQDVYTLIQSVRAGLPFNLYQELVATMPFTLTDWATYLHLSERTLQRYKKEEATFDAPQSEKILEILLLIKKGTEVFEDKENFAAWLEASNVALGHVKPKDLLDSSFGINLLREELIRIEHGVLA